MTVEKLLAEIEQKPELFIGRRDVLALRHFLTGYIIAMKELNTNFDDSLLDDFTRFLAQKYEDSRAFDWAHLIVANEKNDAFSAFFRLLNEYSAQK